jgi:hypothetical protein
MTAFFGIPLSQKGAAGGVATLDEDGRVVQDVAPSGDLVAEVAARTAADDALDGRVAALETAPFVSDVDLQAEAAARAEADSLLDARLDAVETGKQDVASAASPSVLQAVLFRLAALPELLIVGTGLTYDPVTLVLTDAPVSWPDGDTGAYHATSFSVNGVDAYTITKTNGTTTLTFTQPLMTRNASGQVTARPALTVA